jgi:hypothetical protein
VLGQRQVRVALKELPGNALSFLNQLHVRQACQAQLLDKAGLTGSQEIAWTALLEVFLGQDKTVVRLDHG